MQSIAHRIISGLGSAVDSSGAWRCARQSLHVGSTASCAEFQLNTVRAESFYDSTVEKVRWMSTRGALA